MRSLFLRLSACVVYSCVFIIESLWYGKWVYNTTSDSAGSNSGELKEEGLSDGRDEVRGRPIGGTRSQDWDFLWEIWYGRSCWEECSCGRTCCDCSGACCGGGWIWRDVLEGSSKGSLWWDASEHIFLEAPSPLSLLLFKFVEVSMGVSCAVIFYFDFFLVEALVADDAEVGTGVGVGGRGSGEWTGA